MKSALIFQGGWDGHHPAEMADFAASGLRKNGFAVTVADSLAALDDAAAVSAFDLVSPCWTMGSLTPEQTANLSAAVRAGTGLGGFHGGMGDAFRGNLDYEWMVGGHFVGHPHVGPYEVLRTKVPHPVTEGFPESLGYDSEQYYLLVDPGVTVLAETDYAFDGDSVAMPVLWVKHWGGGRVFYSALGHHPAEFDRSPAVAEATLRGLLWAGRAL